MGERHTAWKGDTAWGWAQGRGPEPRGEEGQEWANRGNPGGSGEHLRVCFRCPLTQSRVAEERAPQVGASPRVGCLDRHPGGGPLVVWLTGKLRLTGLRTTQTGLEQANPVWPQRQTEGVVFPWGIHPRLREGRERGEVWRPESG